ncbi:isochorismatase family protein [Talaromyces stipitatus ATCC 10500]|uniref:Isochorismatase family protein n=1 Tax=Talaromyces stipitatus (strain ATCC 10500 / CBS 375.48 / QM 6759 / NRRL 1006) TaxID=441959 RepID=B8MCL8_TALSN|nr:isochorismatase family protein [Talaromyces stipitatus ATCC 10500]EED18834.1 isochorismatase family protein [Talaromyces stipitatus ATCC 10500]
MSKTALLVMDYQAGIISRLSLPENHLQLLANTIDTARPYAKIIYVTVAFRPGHPEVSASNATFSAAAKSNSFVSGSPETQIDPVIAPKEGDILIEKKRVSAFTGSGLDLVLKGLGVETLVLAGISTGGVVLSTVCEAADKDFKLVVLKDFKIFSKRGEVLGAEEWLQKLKA